VSVNCRQDKLFGAEMCEAEAPMGFLSVIVNLNPTFYLSCLSFQLSLIEVIPLRSSLFTNFDFSVLFKSMLTSSKPHQYFSGWLAELSSEGL
jgi:hypothetical protein